MSEQRYVNPEGEITGAFIAPDSGFTRTKKEGLELLPHGLNLGSIYCIVDLGTHKQPSYANKNVLEEKRMLKIGIEHPQLKQIYYEDDTVARSATSWIDCSFSIAEKSTLKKAIDAVVQKKTNIEDARKYDISKLLGATVLIDIEHTLGKDGKTTYANAKGISSQGSFPIPMGYHKENELLLFFIDKEGNNFRTNNYAKLPSFLKKKVLASNEAQLYISKGGSFAKLKDEQPNNQSYSNTPPPPGPQQQGQRKFEMIANDYSLEEYKSHGWTEDSLVQQGKARWVTATSSVPAGPPSPPVANNYSPFENGDDVPF